MTIHISKLTMVCVCVEGTGPNKDEGVLRSSLLGRVCVHVKSSSEYGYYVLINLRTRLRTTTCSVGKQSAHSARKAM